MDEGATGGTSGGTAGENIAGMVLSARSSVLVVLQVLALALPSAAASVSARHADARAPAAGQTDPDGRDPGLTAAPGIEVGHHVLDDAPTGCTVVLARAGAVAGVDVRGGAPGTRETALLDPARTVQRAHAIVLSGGSAFGLAAADGAARFLRENDIGFEVGGRRVPIVPAAVLFDLGVAGEDRPTPGADCGYRAAASASRGPVGRGNAGAGAGATVGKSLGLERAMKGGLGSVSLHAPDGLVVAALVAVNALGDIVDPGSGDIVAGARDGDGGFADARRLLFDRSSAPGFAVGSNTTIGVVAVNAALTQAEATRVAQMAHDGLARTVYPAHTPADGDAIFVLATGEGGDAAPVADVGRIGALAAEATARAVLDAVRSAESLPGFPSASEFRRADRR